MTGGGPDRRSGRTIAQALRWATASMVIERVWPRAWPVVGVVFVFLGLALTGLMTVLPGPVHAFVLAAFAMAAVAAVLFGWRQFSAPRAESVRRRVERDSGLDHQPLAALSDDLVVGRGDAVAAALWAANRARAAQAASKLNVSIPEPDIARRDPFALRALAVMSLVIGIGAAWTDDPIDRLVSALTPTLSDPAARVAQIQIWVTPPPYTASPPLTRTWAPTDIPGDNPDIRANAPDILRVPAGSRILARIVGGTDPVMRLGATETPFQLLSGTAETDPVAARRAFRVDTDVPDPDGTGDPVDLAFISDGQVVRTWPVRIVGDRAPSVEYTAPPASDGPRLRLPYEANDDYGITDLAVVIQHQDGAALADGSTEVRASLPMGRKRGQIVSGAPVRDFSDHPWAGTPVSVRVEARDATGAVGATEDFVMALPFRTFNHPVARALAEARRSLVLPSPSIVDQVAATLDELSLRPARFYHDTVVFLGLRIARGRLHHDGTLDAIHDVQDLMWNLAIRIEDGEYALAERELLEAQERVRQAMQDGAGSDVLEQMMDDLTRSLEKFLDAARDEMSPDSENLPADPSLEMLDADMFAEMIERARELMRMGNMEAARQVMAELGRMLQSVQSAVRGGSEMAEQMARAREMMDGLRDLAERQQDLMDQSFEALRQQRGSPSLPDDPQAAPQNSDAASEQLELRQTLGELMLQMDNLLGSIPPEVGDAERAMRRAQGSLSDGDLPGAVRNQGDALSNLQQATENVAEQMAQQFGAMGRIQGQGQGSGLQPGRGSDPFGRGRQGFQGASMDDGSVVVPTEAEMRRAQQLMQELRRRAGERSRPEIERHYIDRLLKRFQ